MTLGYVYGSMISSFEEKLNVSVNLRGGKEGGLGVHGSIGILLLSASHQQFNVNHYNN